MITNLLILAFVGLMAYWWGALQGLFSAFMHLVVTIAAMSIAVALWEPVALGFLMERMPAYAWGVGLLAPFVLVLLVLRKAMDKLVPQNLDFHSMTNTIAGGVVGLIAGVLTAGFTLVGLMFLPLDANAAGYQPITIDNQGRATGGPGTGLFIKADRITAGFLESLSAGPFSTGQSLAMLQPQIGQQAALYRVRYANKSSLTAMPGTISVESVTTHALSVPGLPEAVERRLNALPNDPRLQLVAVDTVWIQRGGTYDHDGMLRVPPSQVRLVAHHRYGSDVEAHLHAPIAFAQFDAVTQSRKFVPIDSEQVYVQSAAQSTTLSWVFAIELDATPKYLIARRLRLELPAQEDFKTKPTQMAEALGDLTLRIADVGQDPTDPANPNGAQAGPRVGVGAGLLAGTLAIDATLPRMISRNLATGMEFRGDLLVSGDAEVRPMAGFIDPSTPMSRGFLVHPHQAMIRAKVDPDRAKSLLGTVMVQANMTQQVYLEDNLGQRWFPNGYVWLKRNGFQRIYFDPANPVMAVGRLPLRDMQPGDELYLYFTTQRNIRIVAFHVGSKMRQDVTLDIPK